MKNRFYTFFIASNDSGTVHRFRVPFYLLHVLALFAFVGGLTVVFAVGSYSRMLWKVTNYNSLRREQDSLKVQYRQLQTQVSSTNQRLSSLQSLAGEVAMSYGITRFKATPFDVYDSNDDDQESFQHSVDEFNFLEQNTSAVAMESEGLRLIPGPRLGNLAIVPSLWPVIGEITAKFGERLDPFSGEGAFHAGIDIASHYGDPVRATADGVVTAAEMRAGYGRAIVIDHGFGVTTLYGHLSAFNTHVGMQVKRGDVIGYEGESGRATGPHVHYEVRIYNTPVNPWPYLRSNSTATNAATNAATAASAPTGD